MQKYTKLGWIGLGVMGEPMCQHLLAKGNAMAVNTRTREKATAVVQNGAQWCATPAQVAEHSDVIFTMVGLEQEVRDVYFSAEGLFKANIENKIFIDMGTTAPRLTLEIAEYAQQHCATAIDAPVSGGDVGAKNATLSIMAAGDEKALASVMPLFDCLGKTQLMGKAGNGQHTKMCNQIVVAGTMIGVCEALLYAKKSGLDCERLIAAIRPGAAGCWTLDNLAPRIVKDDFAPGFMVNHFIKDLSIAVQEADAMQMSLPGLELARMLYESLRDLGHGRSGTQALLLALDSLSEE